MKRFYEPAKSNPTEYTPTQHELERREELDTRLTPEDKKQMLFHYARRVLRDADNNIQTVINGDTLAWFTQVQKEEVIQNMQQIIRDNNLKSDEYPDHSSVPPPR